MFNETLRRMELLALGPDLRAAAVMLTGEINSGSLLVHKVLSQAFQETAVSLSNERLRATLLSNVHAAWIDGEAQWRSTGFLA